MKRSRLSLLVRRSPVVGGIFTAGMQARAAAILLLLTLLASLSASSHGVQTLREKLPCCGCERRAPCALGREALPAIMALRGGVGSCLPKPHAAAPEAEGGATSLAQLQGLLEGMEQLVPRLTHNSSDLAAQTGLHLTRPS